MKLTYKQKINILVKALRFYKQRGTKLLMVDNDNKLFVENGIIADRALVKIGANKKLSKKKQYLK